MLSVAKTQARNKFDCSVRFLQANMVPCFFSENGLVESAHQVLGKMGLLDKNGLECNCGSMVMGKH